MTCCSGYTISVIIPSFNRLIETGRAVRSALAQSYPPLDVIVVDDGSDRPVSQDGMGIDDPRLRILRLDKNSGPSAARQFGIDAGRGNVLAFLDSDDVWLPNKLAAQVVLLQRWGPIAVASGWIALPEDGRPQERLIPRESRRPLDFAAGCWFSPGSTLTIPRRVFDLVGPFNQELRRLEDYEWFLRFALAGGRLVVTPEVAAIISVGRRGRVDAVRRAKSIIEKELATVRHPIADRRFRRTAKAYLSLEMAKAAHNEGRPVLMARHMLRSLLLKPRLRLPLERWWTAIDNLADRRDETEVDNPAGQSDAPSSNSVSLD